MRRCVKCLFLPLEVFLYCVKRTSMLSLDTLLQKRRIFLPPSTVPLREFIVPNVTPSTIGSSSTKTSDN